VSVGDELTLLERPFPNMPVSRLYLEGYGPKKFQDKEFLKKCLNTGLMDKGWLPKILDALQ
jgi:hypothetical protein